MEIRSRHIGGKRIELAIRVGTIVCYYSSRHTYKRTIIAGSIFHKDRDDKGWL